ncbi:hypothetical protein Tco_1228578 [Tanacetum coccineum]
MEQMTSIYDMVGQIIQKKEEERRNAENQAAKDRYWKIPICYDDDEDYTCNAPTQKGDETNSGSVLKLKVLKAKFISISSYQGDHSKGSMPRGVFWIGGKGFTVNILYDLSRTPVMSAVPSEHLQFAFRKRFLAAPYSPWRRDGARMISNLIDVLRLIPSFHEAYFRVNFSQGVCYLTPAKPTKSFQVFLFPVPALTLLRKVSRSNVRNMTFTDILRPHNPPYVITLSTSASIISGSSDANKSSVIIRLGEEIGVFHPGLRCFSVLSFLLYRKR